MFLDKVIFNKTKVPVLNAVLDVTQRLIRGQFDGLKKSITGRPR